MRKNDFPFPMRSAGHRFRFKLKPRCFKFLEDFVFLNSSLFKNNEKCDARCKFSLSRRPLCLLVGFCPRNAWNEKFHVQMRQDIVQNVPDVCDFQFVFLCEHNAIGSNGVSFLVDLEKKRKINSKFCEWYRDVRFLFKKVFQIQNFPMT